ncbi:cytochrome P450 [Blyttiomyces helicus]|uniref:Cytochrome P450 n=1 Tax=Blyttiomyces helicus TaxID=388810 RepID=A0A4P9W4J8_9FUNG|nr:cytochrome P450 [Blyttiomyces helicus]|eukprot:RKO87279.1 cytochrome P450 [Blyttiomyces helicus]
MAALTADYDREILKILGSRIDSLVNDDAAAAHEPDKEVADDGDDDIRALDILSLTVASSQREGRPLRLVETFSTIKSLIFAGHDTTATLMSWVCYLLGTHLSIEEKVLKEIDSVLGSRTEPTLADLSALTHLGDVIKEALRLFPAAGSARIGPKGAKLCGYDVENVIVYVAPFVIHRVPSLWGADADVFRPERWSDDQINPDHFVPFSRGRADCLGQKFALLEGKTILATVYRQFVFRPVKEIRAKRALTLIPGEDCEMRVMKRS